MSLARARQPSEMEPSVRSAWFSSDPSGFSSPAPSWLVMAPVGPSGFSEQT